MKGAPNMIPCRPKKGGQGQLPSSFQQANLRNICRALVSAAEAALPLLQGPPQNADHPLAQIDSKPATGVGSVSLRFPRLAPGASILHSPARTTKSLCSEAGRSRPPGRRLPQRQARGGGHKLSPTRHISGDANRRSPSAGHVSRCRCRCCRLPRLFAPAGPPGTAAPARRNLTFMHAMLRMPAS